jgi:hypothetical protein
MEVGVNFLVVTIICIMLLGIGIMLMNKFIKIGQEQVGKVNEANQRALIDLMSTGEHSQVALIPSIAYVSRGELAQFSLGINNELGEERDFSIVVEPRDINSPPFSSFDTTKITRLYSDQSMKIKNNEKGFFQIVIKMPKEADKGSYIFNVYVCKQWRCSRYDYENDPGDNVIDYQYGELLHLQVNVKN